MRVRVFGHTVTGDTVTVLLLPTFPGLHGGTITPLSALVDSVLRHESMTWCNSGSIVSRPRVHRKVLRAGGHAVQSNANGAVMDP